MKKQNKLVNLLKQIDTAIKEHQLLFRVALLIVSLILAGVYIWYQSLFEEVLPSQLVYIISTLFGIVISLLSASVIQVIALINEDRNKVDYEMGDKYTDEYTHILGTVGQVENQEFKYKQTVCFNEREKVNINVKDSLRVFEPDEFIMGNSLRILGAHGGSTFSNSYCIRLKDYELKRNGAITDLTLHTQRTTYLNSMITNRAMDYTLAHGASIRSIYEFGRTISDYKDSKMSNHIGVNALAVLTDGNIVIARRSFTGTTSKNIFVSSIAYAFKIGEKTCNENKDDDDDDYIEADISNKLFDEQDMFDTSIRYLIYKKFSKRVENTLHKDTKIRFLGFGQDVYEGGKPQFYFAVELPVDTKQYEKLVKGEGSDSDSLDRSSGLFVCNNFAVDKKKEWKLTFDIIRGDRVRSASGLFERSFYINLYHYLKFYKGDEGKLKALERLEIIK